MQNKYTIIVAGGNGTRMHSTVPKQFLLLAGKPVLTYALQKFYDADVHTRIIVVLPPAQITYWEDLCRVHDFKIPHTVIAGGETRFHSVKNGLDTVKEEDGVVAIHDGVRPLVSVQLINTCFEGAVQNKTAVPVVECSESLRVLENMSSRAVQRSQYRMVQTPQCFSLSILKNAYRQPFTDNFTDDATVVEASGQPVMLVEGETCNIKITTPEDLLIAHALLQHKAS